MLEFWPEYNSGPLWNGDGTSVELMSLGLPPDLIERLTAWNGAYDDSNLPFETNDRGWLDEGVRLLAEIRAALPEHHEIIVTEPWWGEEPHT